MACYQILDSSVCENVSDAVAGSSVLFLSLHEEGSDSAFSECYLSNHVFILCKLTNFKNFLGIHTETAAVQQFEAQVPLAVCSWP